MPCMAEDGFRVYPCNPRLKMYFDTLHIFLLNRNNPFAEAQGTLAVSDGKDGQALVVFLQLLQGAVNLLFGFIVEGRGSFVQ